MSPGSVVRSGFSDNVSGAELSADRIIGVVAVPGLAIDLSNRRVQDQTFEGCGRTYQRFVIFDMKDGGLCPVVSASAADTLTLNSAWR